MMAMLTLVLNIFLLIIIFFKAKSRYTENFLGHCGTSQKIALPALNKQC